ncbi:sodium-independent sulfate anion [Nesidiocoris tenuis]|uniref:Sodium-independent sulfate anion n=1 Tax=Nesidiocoris tenuis TaxID=355587 RepID=A0ABN7BH35_9HEMI|nr:sodium-independent sulfate anion [Nesidiocoris tenuis]
MVLGGAMRRIFSRISKGFRHLMRPRKRKQSWRTSLKKTLQRRVPITRWICDYNREDAIGDLIAGVTIALTQIPQGIAYAALADLDPQYGLNSAFMGCFIYVFFGTVKEVVIGPSSLMALFTYQYTSKLNIDFVILLTFLVGVVELLMGIFHLGFLVSFISTPVVSGFTTATALIVGISQFKNLFGMSFKSDGILDNLVKIWNNLSLMRTGDTILGVTCLVTLLCLKKLKEYKVSDKVSGHQTINGLFWFLSTGRNAIAVILTSFIAFSYTNNGLQPPFVTTKKVDSGIPSIMLPPTSTTIGNHTYEFTEMVSELGVGYMVIPVVAVLANIAIAKAFVTGTVDATQEMLALSLGNLAGSLFQAIPSCGAFSRSAVISASGVRTPLAGLYSAGLTLMALKFLSPYFHYIPRSTLSAILIAAVIFLVDWEIYKPLIVAGAKLELVTLIATTFVCLFVGVELGLLFGVLVGAATLIYKWARPKVTVQKAKTEWGEYVIVKPELGLYFPSVDYISTYVIKMADEEPDERIPILIDCKDIRDSDYTIAKSFKALLNTFEKRGQKLAFLDVRPKCQKIWKSAGCKVDNFWLSENLTDRLYQGNNEKGATALVEIKPIKNDETERITNSGTTVNEKSEVEKL